MLKLVYGVDINDADYKVRDNKWINGKSVYVDKCKIYSFWASMLGRCYSEKFKDKQPTYHGCHVAKEWHLFSNFKAWMAAQDWQGNELDKDLLGNGKIYSPDTCCFISKSLNNFIKFDVGVSGGGVYFHEQTGKWNACVSKTLTSKARSSVGLSKTKDECYLKVVIAKSRALELYMSESKDCDRVKSALNSTLKRWKKWIESQKITNEMVRLNGFIKNAGDKDE